MLGFAQFFFGPRPGYLQPVLRGNRFLGTRQTATRLEIRSEWQGGRRQILHVAFLVEKGEIRFFANVVTPDDARMAML
jgi:hypothetical protein